MAMTRVLELLILVALSMQQTSQQVTRRENFCNGDDVDLQCPSKTVIRISEAWYMFVHNVTVPEQDCSVHFNHETLCAHKIQHAHNDTHVGILEACDDLQVCRSVKANTTIAVACQGLQPSPPEYVQIAYQCINQQRADPQGVRTVTANHAAGPSISTRAIDPVPSHSTSTISQAGGSSISTRAIEPVPAHSTSTASQAPARRTIRPSQNTNTLLTTSTISPSQPTHSSRAAVNLTVNVSTVKPGNNTGILLTTLRHPAQPPSGGSSRRGTSPTPNNASTMSTKHNGSTKSTLPGSSTLPGPHSGGPPADGSGSSISPGPHSGGPPADGSRSSTTDPSRSSSNSLIPHNGSSSTTITQAPTQKTNYSQPATHSSTSQSSTQSTYRSQMYTTISHQPSSPSGSKSSHVLTTSTTPIPGNGQSASTNASKVHSMPQTTPTKTTNTPSTRTLVVTSKSTTPRELLTTTRRRTTTTRFPLFPRTTTTTSPSSTTGPSTTKDLQAGGLHLRLAHESLAMVISVPVVAVITIIIIFAVVIVCMRRKKDAKAHTFQEDQFNRVMFYPSHNGDARVASSLDNPTFGLDNQTKIRPAVLMDVDQGRQAYRFNNPSGRLVGVRGAFGGMTSSHRDLSVTLRELEESAKMDDEYSTNPSSRVGYEPLPEQAYASPE